MQKTVVRNPNQSPIRRNLLNIAGIVVQGETITPPNGDRLLGGYGVAWLNNQDAASQTTGQDNPLPECNCESGGGGGGGGGSGGGGGVQPSGNCEKKNISELKQVLDDYANQSFCDKEFPEVQFSTFIGYDKPPSDSTAKEIELRMLCPSDECNDDEELCENPDNLPVLRGDRLYNAPALFAQRIEHYEKHGAYAELVLLNTEYRVVKVEPNTETDVYIATEYRVYWKAGKYADIICGWFNELSCSPYYRSACDKDKLTECPVTPNSTTRGCVVYIVGGCKQNKCPDLTPEQCHRELEVRVRDVSLAEACEHLRK